MLWKQVGVKMRGKKGLTGEKLVKRKVEKIIIKNSEHDWLRQSFAAWLSHEMTQINLQIPKQKLKLSLQNSDANIFSILDSKSFSPL